MHNQFNYYTKLKLIKIKIKFITAIKVVPSLFVKNTIYNYFILLFFFILYQSFKKKN